MKATVTPFPAEQNPNDISLRDLLAPLFRRKRALIATFLVVLIAVILIGLLMGPMFSSHMAVLVNRERLDPLVTTESTSQTINASSPVTEDEINSEAELLRSQDVLEKVVKANGLADRRGFSLNDLLYPDQTGADRVARAVKGLAKKLKIEPVAKANLIDVTYTSSDPKASYGVLKSLGDLYVEKHVAVHRPAGSYDFFAQETEKYRQALEDSEVRLRNLSREQGVAAPDLQRTDMALQVTNAIGQSHIAQQAIAADIHRIYSDEQQMQVLPQRTTTQQASSAADKLLDALKASLLAAQDKRTQLALKYDPKYPLVQEADQEIAQTEAAIAAAEKTRYVTETTDRDPTFELVREDLAKTQADLAAQRANLVATQRSIETMQGQMIDLDKKSLLQQDYLRDAKANEDNYLLYLAKREQERTSDALDKIRIANVAIAVPPAIPVLPVYPFPMVVLVAVGLALFLSIAAAYSAEYFDSSFHTPAQVIEILGIQSVVSVPKRTA
jgi:uncharacterized protein involved in exopolysaccharide biosynthesis